MKGPRLWCLPWELSTFRTTTVRLNRDAVDGVVAAKLAPEYLQDALLVKNVKPGEAWYLPDQDPIAKSDVSQLDGVHISGESAVVLCRVGDGKLGYVGDVDPEPERKTDDVVLAMIGLL
ncbi:hypothetical protein ACJZ2D_010104 [Fusarium nematophilum]